MCETTNAWFHIESSEDVACPNDVLVCDRPDRSGMCGCVLENELHNIYWSLVYGVYSDLYGDPADHLEKGDMPF